MIYNETKTIMKLAKNTADEKLKTFLNEHYLTDDVEVKEEVKVEETVEETKKVEVTTEEKVAEKTEEKKETITDEFKKLFEGMNEKINALEEQAKKSNPFGRQTKVVKTDEKANSFDELFSKLNK